MTDILNEDLNNKLNSILKKFHYSIIKDDLGKVFGKDVIGATDIL
jgi:hypothetical protein